MYIICLAYVKRRMEEYFEFEGYSFGTVNQVSRDWNTAPFTDIIVTEAENCTESHPDHPELVFSRAYYGNKIGCDCLDIVDPYIFDGGDSITPNVVCGYNETRLGCEQVLPMWPVMMGKINGQRVCGRRAISNFVDRVRPVKSPSGDYACPEGYSQCGKIDG